MSIVIFWEYHTSFAIEISIQHHILHRLRIRPFTQSTNYDIGTNIKMSRSYKSTVVWMSRATIFLPVLHITIYITMTRFTRVTSIPNEFFAHSLVCSDRIFSAFSRAVLWMFTFNKYSKFQTWTLLTGLLWWK